MTYSRRNANAQKNEEIVQNEEKTEENAQKTEEIVQNEPISTENQSKEEEIKAKLKMVNISLKLKNSSSKYI